MISISKEIEKIIKNQPFLIEALNEGLINISSLARSLQPELEKKLYKPVSLASIIMSLKRMPAIPGLQTSGKLKNVLSGLGNITVRSNLSEYTYENSETLIDKQKTLLHDFSNRKDVFYTFSCGVAETTIITGNIATSEILYIFGKEKLLNSFENLTSITVKLPINNNEQIGLYYQFFRNLAWDGINVYEVISTTNEFSILIHDKDTALAFEVFRKMKSDI
jgi:hypothetical protein